MANPNPNPYTREMFALLAAVALADPGAAAPAADRFDLELQDVDVHAAIRMIADLGDLDIVIPDTVYGTVSIRLDDVTWEGALAAVLYVEGLQAIPADGALRVSPAR